MTVAVARGSRPQTSSMASSDISTSRKWSGTLSPWLEDHCARLRTRYGVRL